jgi:glycosyltransferase involved in cell wall biosynthesis
VPDARRQLEQRYAFDNNSHMRYLLYVGSELPRKNITVLLQALALVCQEYDNVRLLKIGKAGPPRYRTRTMQMIHAYNLSERVCFFEDIPDCDLPLFYNAADVYVSPSHMEGFGFPLLEAMACGTPVICSDAASLPEVAGDAALLRSPNDIEGFAQAIIHVLEDETLRKQMIERGLQRAAAFSWHQTALATLAVYHRVKHL